jgi:hypothetical protein
MATTHSYLHRADGVITSHDKNYSHVRVRLDDGADIVAVLPNLRRLGSLFGPLTDWKVRVLFRKAQKLPRVVRLARPGTPLED